jgi:hypothetical protein
MEVPATNMTPHDQLSQQYGGDFLGGVEILGESKNINRIRKLFEHSTVKIKVVQDRPTAQEAFAWDDDTRDTLTEPCTDGGDGYGEPSRNIYGSGDDNSSGLGMYSHSAPPLEQILI